MRQTINNGVKEISLHAQIHEDYITNNNKTTITTTTTTLDKTHTHTHRPTNMYQNKGIQRISSLII